MAKKNNNPETIIMDLPEVKDIPGQENIKPPVNGEMADTTASSAGEEGDEILGTSSSDDLGIVMGTEADVSADERDMLSHLDSRRADREEDSLAGGALDNTDEDGVPLEERTGGYDLSGEDLDTPGIEDDESEDVE